MQLTPLAKGLIAVIVLGTVGSVAWNLYKSNNPAQAEQSTEIVTSAAPVAKHNAETAPNTAPQSTEAKNTQNNFNTYQSIINKGVVRVSVQSPAKPFFYTDNGIAKGFNVEFMRLLFAQAEFTKNAKQIVIDTDHAVDTYPEVPEQLIKTDNRGNPSVDIAIDGLTFADGDLAGVVYTVPYISDFGYTLITGPRSTIRDIADVTGKRIGILQGDPDVKAYAQKNLPGAQLIELSDATTNGARDWMARAIHSGQVDAIIYDYPFGVSEVENTDLVMAISKLPNSDVRYKIGVRANDSELLQNLNLAISKVKESNEYLNLLRKYFISSKVVQAGAAANGEKIYVVKSGDTLSLIATRELGDQNRYRQIEARNNLPNPNLIQVGQKLVLPKI
ncbi:transporter substrate-binding domain-containing protein [Chitinibacter sp. SCUT-21]|uniref:transporter substrate-binding and LysM peptidoglycan-binding domain-containing protein n=1 Tax=Chitinibacter sp. SCUT-21 TaxID=2970891 RepID=UPI0035A68532